MTISIDTRTLQPGDTFIPLIGPRFDGHDFIDEALRKGARKILNVKDIGQYAKRYRKKLSCRVIAVTGSVGKTTIKDMLSAILGQKFQIAQTQGNQNNEIGVPLTILRADSNTEILILELAMRQKGQIRYLSQIARPDVVVLTGVGRSHIQFLKTTRNIALAKSEIFRNPLQWEQKDRTAFIQFNSPHYKILSKRALDGQFKVIPYEGQNRSDQNLSCCYIVGRYFGLTDQEIKEGLNVYKPSEHRLNTIKCRDNITLIDDTYNASPEGVQYALDYIKTLTGRKVIVLGDMCELGAHAFKAHEEIVELLIECGVDIVFTFGKESSVIQSRDFYSCHFSKKDVMIKQIKNELKRGDVVLVKGSRAMKMDEVVHAIQHS
ncbi:MAG: UDP-N-acetylmuramoyl-tripeptide--D-alanyl-D-alanine ligase [Candidatus Margulisbacteria bacterium]|nr:UDP-N-acetylmuramoyl-tripeptide--D-alanyl-D-alanine ligase [Candidatus Margulisiibacteriota bacterium]